MYCGGGIQASILISASLKRSFSSLYLSASASEPIGVSSVELTAACGKDISKETGSLACCASTSSLEK